MVPLGSCRVAIAGQGSDFCPAGGSVRHSRAAPAGRSPHLVAAEPPAGPVWAVLVWPKQPRLAGRARAAVPAHGARPWQHPGRPAPPGTESGPRPAAVCALEQLPDDSVCLAGGRPARLAGVARQSGVGAAGGAAARLARVAAGAARQPIISSAGVAGAGEQHRLAVLDGICHHVGARGSTQEAPGFQLEHRAHAPARQLKPVKLPACPSLVNRAGL